MEITAASPPATAQQAGSSRSAITSDFDTFLKLLTAQIRNQDPMEPADATAYTAQLATFSNVEQAVKTNDLLETMIQRLDTQQIAGATDWIGMEVRHSGAVRFDGRSIRLSTNINASADRADLVVRNAAGNEVSRMAIDPDGDTLDWSGQGPASDLPPGLYRLTVESWAGAQQLADTPVDHYARVTEVVMGNGGTELVLSGGVRLPAGDMQAIREPRPG